MNDYIIYLINDVENQLSGVKDKIEVLATELLEREVIYSDDIKKIVGYRGEATPLGHTRKSVKGSNFNFNYWGV